MSGDDERAITEEVEMACDWTDYRADYGVTQADMVVAHKAFTAGWMAARHGTDRGVLR